MCDHFQLFLAFLLLCHAPLLVVLELAEYVPASPPLLPICSRTRPGLSPLSRTFFPCMLDPLLRFSAHVSRDRAAYPNYHSSLVAFPFCVTSSSLCTAPPPPDRLSVSTHAHTCTYCIIACSSTSKDLVPCYVFGI